MKKSQSIKAPANPPEKDHGKDMKTFEAQPSKTKELEILQLKSEKATRQASVALQKLIQEKSRSWET